MPSLARMLAPTAVLVVLASTAGCTPAGDEDIATRDDLLNESSSPRSGSTISSPSVDPSKRYWGARTIAFLEKVGYLTGAEAELAHRADGIIANAPRNGKLGVDELASLESSHAGPLFPEERAMIPKLWKILEMSSVSTTYKPRSLQGTERVKDDSSATRFHLPIEQLKSTLQPIARRIELTRNDDGDALTISGKDVADAYADRGSYLPLEVLSFPDLSWTIADAAPKLANDVRRVEIPDKDDVLATLDGGVSVRTRVGTGSPPRSWNETDGPRAPEDLSVRHMVRITGNAFHTISFDPASGEDRRSDSYAVFDARRRVEVWKDGARIAEFDVEPTVSTVQIPFGYAVKVPDSLFTLFCDEYMSDTCAYGVAASPPNQIDLFRPFISYGFSLNGHYRLDLFPGGFASIVSSSRARADCYPTFTRTDHDLRLTGCKVLSSTSMVPEISVQYDTRRSATWSFTDTPSLGTVSSSAGTAMLYAY